MNIWFSFENVWYNSLIKQNFCTWELRCRLIWRRRTTKQVTLYKRHGDLAINIIIWSGIVLKLIQMYVGSTGPHRSESLGYCLHFHHELFVCIMEINILRLFFPFELMMIQKAVHCSLSNTLPSNMSLSPHHSGVILTIYSFSFVVIFTSSHIYH